MSVSRLSKVDIGRLDSASSTVDNISARKGSCAVWSVFDPRPNHTFFRPMLIRKGPPSSKTSKVSCSLLVSE